jgi:hypothetical protein
LRIPPDIRLLSGASGEDYRIQSIRAPEPSQPGEGFIVEIQATGTDDASVPYEVLRDDIEVGDGTMSFKDGKATVRLAARSTDPGAHI